MGVFLNIMYLFSLIICQTTGQGLRDFRVESVNMCKERPDQLVKFYFTPKDSTPGIQLIDLNITASKPIGENTLIKCKGYIDVNKRWVQLFYYEDDFCFVFKTYVGQLFYDLERAAGILPGTCPISKGIYHVVNFPLNYEKMKLQHFHFGQLKYRLEFIDKTTKNMNSCFIAIIVNK